MTKEQILDKLYQAKDYASDALNVAQQASELASEAETQAAALAPSHRARAHIVPQRLVVLT